MPTWVLIAVVAGGVALIAAAALIGFFAYRAAERRALLRLISRREGVTAVGQSLESVVGRLADQDIDSLVEFATDPDHVERQVFSETAQRANELAYELDTMPMPRRLVPVAESLGDAAWVVGDQAGKVDAGTTEDDVLHALSELDLDFVRQVFAVARGELQVACEVCRLSDESVYGGGLYL